MTKRHKLFLFVLVFSVLVAIYYVEFMRSLNRSFAAAESPNGEQFWFDAFVQSVLSFPFFHIDWIFSLPINDDVLTKVCVLLNGVFWALVVTVPIGIIAMRWKQPKKREH